MGSYLIWPVYLVRIRKGKAVVLVEDNGLDIRFLLPLRLEGFAQRDGQVIKA